MIDKNIEDDKFDEIVVFYRDEHNRHYQEQVALDKILKRRPIITYIKFDGLFKMFMLYYSIVYKNSIKKELLQEAINELSVILRSKHIIVEPMNDLTLFKTVYDKNYGQNPKNPNRKFNVTDDSVTIKIMNLEGFLSEIMTIFNKETLSFMKKIISYYVTTPRFENKIFYDELGEKLKGI